MTNAAPRYYYRLTPEERKVVNYRVATRIGELVDRQMERLRLFPGMEGEQGRALLAWFESLDANWWANLAATYPLEARRLAVIFGSLVRRYYPELVTMANTPQRPD